MSNFTFKNDKKIIIVSDLDYQPYLYNFKRDNPKLNIKFITRKDILDTLGIQINEEAISILLKKHIPFQKAKRYLELIQTSNFSKSQTLTNIYKILKDNNLIMNNDPYALLELEKSNVYFFEMKDDIEIVKLIERHNLLSSDESHKIQVNHLFFEDLNSQLSEYIKKPYVNYFFNKYEQFMYIFAEFRRELTINKKLAKDIFLLIEDAKDLFYVKLFSKMFGVPTYTCEQSPVGHDEIIKKKVLEIYQTHSFAFTDDELNITQLRELSSLIKKYKINELDDFKFAYNTLLDVINSKHFKNYIGNSGINYGSKFVFDKDKEIYITNFYDGCFYKQYKDDDELSDKELRFIDANTSCDKTKIERQKKLNYLKYLNIKFVSRPIQHLSDKIYDSQFVKELTEPKKPFVINHLDINGQGTFNLDAIKMQETTLLDKQYSHSQYDSCHGEKDNKISYSLLDYDHSYKTIKDDGRFSGKIKWNITNLESYPRCPFAYYLNNILPPVSQDFFDRARGTLIHGVTEKIYDSSASFDHAFIYGKKLLIKQLKDNNQTLKPKEEIFIEVIKVWLEKFFEITRDRYFSTMHLSSLTPASEFKVSYSISDGEITHDLTGSIDSIIFTEYNNNKFFTIVDYKSGSESFDIDRVLLGISTQLPIYYYALTNNPSYISSEYTFGGFTIQKIYDKSIKHYLTKNSEENLKLKSYFDNSGFKGVALKELDYFKSINHLNNYDFNNDKSDFVNGYKPDILFTDINGNDNLYNLPNGKYNFNDLINDALEATVESIKNIRGCNFNISPLEISSSENTEFTKEKYTSISCNYCKYGDVCFKKLNKDKVNSKKVLIEKILNHLLTDLNDDINELDNEESKECDA